MKANIYITKEIITDLFNLAPVESVKSIWDYTNNKGVYSCVIYLNDEEDFKRLEQELKCRLNWDVTNSSIELVKWEDDN